MKTKLILFIILFQVAFFHAQDPVLMEVNNVPVTKSEFLQIYLKNNNNPKYDKATLDEYMDLFTRFKLKVAEAENLGYDTIPKLIRELNGYKKQLSLPYLIDSAKNESLVKEAYDRLTQEIRVSHILIKLKQNPSPKDTLAAYNRLLSIKKRIENGEDFATIAKTKNGSDDPSAAKNGGDLGFFTAFQMVYPFEEVAYNSKLGKISDIFKTRFGYHILIRTDERDARGTMKAAHLMVSASKGVNKEETIKAEKKINELYQKLQNKESTWEELVELHSDDPSTNKKGGLLPIFGTGSKTRMIPIFEETAFSLPNDGDISKPIRTEYGYHIIKRIEKKDLKSFEELKKEIQAKVNKDVRSKKTQDSFVEKLKQRYAAKEYPENLQWFYENLDSTYYTGKWKGGKFESNKVLFSLKGIDYKQTDFQSYLAFKWRGMPKQDNKSLVDKQYKNWIKTVVLKYEEDVLPSKYPAYKALLKEYHDGILLYEIMSDKVWNKAVKDTTGLKDFYEKNKKNYMWPNRLDATVYECLNMKIAKKVYKMLKKKKNTSKEIIKCINADSELNVDVKMDKFIPEKSDFINNDLSTYNVGRNKVYKHGKKFYVVYVTEKLEIMPKELSETKGMVTSDYQQFLEKEWIKELSNKHKVKVYYDVLYSLGN